MADIFISYSRRDSAFADWLRSSLVAQGRSVWIDTADIPPTSQWRQDIADAIAAAGAVLFVLSPDWLTSEVSQRELQYAIDMKKKLIPVVYRDVEHQSVNPALANLNWIFARPADDPGRALQQIMFAIDTDLDYWREGADLLVKAQQWAQGNRRPAFTLRGEPLRKAEQWLAAGATKNYGPNPLQVEYITAGRRASAQRQRVTISALSVGIVVTLVLSIVATSFAIAADRANKVLGAKAIAANALAALQANDPARALLLAKEAYHLEPSDPVTRGALFSAVSASPHLVSILRSNDTGQLNINDNIYAVAYSGDGKTLLTIDTTHIELWDMTTNHVRLTVSGQDAYRGDLSKDGQIIAEQSERNDTDPITLLNAQSGATIGTLDGSLNETPGSNRALHSISFSPDGKLLAATDCADASCTTHRILIWDVASRNIVQQIPVPLQPSEVYLAFSPDSKSLAFTSYQSHNGAVTSSFTIWNLAQQRALFSHTAPDGEDYDAITFTPHSKGVLVGGLSGTEGKVTDWDIAARQPTVASFIDPDGPIQSVAISADAHWLVTTTTFGEVQLWLTSLSNPYGAPILKGAFQNLAVTISPESDRFVTASDASLTLWSTRPYSSLSPDPATQVANITRSAVSPDGKILAAADGLNNQIALWDLRSGTLIKTIATPFQTITENYTLAFSPDSRSLAVGGINGELALIDIDNGTIEGQPWSLADVPDPSIFLGATNGEIDTIEFSPDSRYLLATSFSSDAAILWDAQSHAFVASIGDGKTTYPDAAAFISNDNIVFGGVDNNVHAILGTWNVAQRKLTATWQYKKNSPTEIDAITTNLKHNTFAVADDSGTITIWDATQHNMLTQIHTNQPETSFGAVQFSSDGSLLLFKVGTTVEIWQAGRNIVETYVQPIKTNSLSLGAILSPGNKYWSFQLKQGRRCNISSHLIGKSRHA